MLVACHPKSGSTFLSTAIAYALGTRTSGLVPGWGRREQELDAALVRYTLKQRIYKNGFVAHHHVRYSEATAKILADYDIKPVVMIRDLFDIVASIRDHARTEAHDGPCAYFTKRHLELPDEQFELVIATLMIPWYINFYMSWRDCPNAVWLTYEELTIAPPIAVWQLCEKLGWRIDAEDAASATGRARADGSRFNVGKSGRGADINPEARAAILGMLDMYPEVHGEPYVQAMLQTRGLHPKGV